MAAMEGPVKVTAAELGLEGDEDDGHMEVDLGNLMVYDPTPAAGALFEGPEGADGGCHALATRAAQALVRRLFALPSEAVPGGRVVQLPPPTTLLPRAKPLPKPRPPTKWEVFAQRKGIVKTKRSKLVWDDAEAEWRRRHGYKRAGDEEAVPVIEAGPDDAPGEDPFTKRRAEKRDRVRKQDAAQAANLKRAAKAGGAGALPPTVRLAAALPERGRGRPAKRKELQPELRAASRAAAVSTASLGKFDPLAKGEAPGDRPAAGASKKQKRLPVTAPKAERELASKAVDSILRRAADDVVDVGAAIRALEAGAREETHKLKNKGANKKGRLTKPGAAQAKRAAAAKGRSEGRGGKRPDGRGKAKSPGGGKGGKRRK